MLTLDPRTWEPTDEYETLINPERDVGPVGIHGITASMVEAAPTFPEIITTLAHRLHGAILIAHNLSFDARSWVTSSSGLAWTLTLAQGYAPTEPPAANSLPHVADTK